jgi:hypothetical protein
VTASTVGATALWGLLGLSLVSVTVRPLVKTLGLPQVVVNLDALLTPFVTIAVVVLAALSWTSLPRLHRWLTAGVVVLGCSMVISWLVATPRSWASLALGGSVLLLLPFAVYLVVMASQVRDLQVVRRTVALMVLLQLVVAAVQYVSLAVAQKAPAGADLVDGTTSHNFWPVFALPASLVLVLSGRDRTRFLWPVAVTLLAVYAEAKAALIVWLPLLVVVGTAYAGSCARARSADRVSTLRSTEDPVARAGLVLVTFAVILVGLWWTPSVQGTWGVFVGHSRALEEFAVNGQGADDGAPTLKQAGTAVRESLTADPVAALFGRGPANTTSHAAEILAQGAKNGVSLPPPGPLATELLTGGDAFKFRDAQSSVLGVLGDLGLVGLVLYLGVCALAAWVLFRAAEPDRPFRSPRAWTVPWIIAGVLAGGILLDWPEQASVVLPLALAVLVLRAPARSRPDADLSHERSAAIDTELPATRPDNAGHPGVAAV